jgi:ribokinase
MLGFKTNFDVISLGTATLDVFLRSPEMEIEREHDGKDICVRYGAKLEVSEIHFETGGGGTNTAVTFARQGLKTAVAAQIGKDFAGARVVADLKKDGVATGFLDIKKEIFTDYSTILWASDGGRTILIYRGKTRLEEEGIAWDKLRAHWFYVSSLEGNLEILKKIIKNATSRYQSKIAWNPGNRELAEKKELENLLPAVTVLNLNKEEMMKLLGTREEDIKKILKKAQVLPCPLIVITDDRRGAYLWERASQTWWHAGIFEEAPRFESTGAGDSFGSGLVAGLIKGHSLTDCLYLATANASSVVTKVGAKKGILRESDLANWPKEKLLIEKAVSD